MPELSYELVLILAPFVLFAGVVDSMAGGGGLITVPAYLAVGLPPSLVLGTNKLVSFSGTSIAARNFLRATGINLQIFIPILLSALVGSYIGALTVSKLDPGFLKWLLVIMIPLIAFLLYRFKSFGSVDRSAEIILSAKLTRGMSLALLVGFHDGFFGPGTGTFFVLGFTHLLGFDLLKASTYGRCLNWATNLAALVTFLWVGSVFIKLGLILAPMSIIGNFIGSKLAIKRGHRVIRPMLFFVMAILLSKVIYDLAVEF